MQSMRRSLEEMERCRGELHLPQGAKESLLVFSKSRLVLQPLEELEHLTHQQAALLEVLQEVWMHIHKLIDLICYSDSNNTFFNLFCYNFTMNCELHAALRCVVWATRNESHKYVSQCNTSQNKLKVVLRLCQWKHPLSVSPLSFIT